MGRWFHVILIAIPILIQVYFNASLVYGLMRLFGVGYDIAAPAALIGASTGEFSRKSPKLPEWAVLAASPRPPGRRIWPSAGKTACLRRV